MKNGNSWKKKPNGESASRRRVRITFNPLTMTTEEKREFTKGPWKAELHIDPQWRISVEGQRFNIVATTCQGNDEANARLIAASPEMFELLQDASKRLGCGCGHDEPICGECKKVEDRIESLIAKVEGK
jgi:hypothetical protein